MYSQRAFSNIRIQDSRDRIHPRIKRIDNEDENENEEEDDGDHD